MPTRPILHSFESVTFANGGAPRLTSTKAYDRLGRLASIVNAYTASVSGLSHAYTYNAANQRIRADRQDSTAWSYTYDALGQITNGSKTLSDGTPVPGLSFAYNFDDIGNRKTATSNGQVSTYTSNLLNQYTQRTVPPVVDVTGSALSGVPVAVSADGFAGLAIRQGDSFFKQLTVDNSSAAQVLNVHVAAEQNPSGAAVTASQQRSVFLPKNPESLVHDADGNLVEDARWQYTWDGENRLVGMETNSLAQSLGVARTQLSFVYDSQGRRIQKTVTSYPLSGLTNVRREYFGNATLAGIPDSIVLGGNINDYWWQGQNIPYGGSLFSYRVTASLYAPVAGTWTFQIGLGYSGARLYVNDVLVIDGWSGTGVLTAPVTLAAAQSYRLRYEFNLLAGAPGEPRELLN
jgi:YD repeat-containing protein